MPSNTQPVDGRRDLTVEFVSRRTVGAADRLTVTPPDGDMVSLLVAPEAAAVRGLKTGNIYRVRDLRWCETDAQVDTPLATSVQELDLTPPFGIVDEQTRIVATSRDHTHDEVGELLHLLDTDETTDRDEALEALPRAIERDPAAGLEAVPILAAMLEAGDAPSAPILAALVPVADAHPCQVAPAVSAVCRHLEAADPVAEDALTVIATVGEHHPMVIRDAVPTLVTLLEDRSMERTVLQTLVTIAKVAPEATLPACETLVSIVESEGSHRVLALAALGYVAKEFPIVANTTVATAIDLLDDDKPRLRTNAAGLLADVADESPDELLPAVPRVIELLDDGDERARYNATSILARVAKAHPTEVEPAIDPLMASLEDAFPYTRSNACWALGYLGAERALSVLRPLERDDPHEEVRSAAGWAIYHLSEDSEGTTV